MNYYFRTNFSFFRLARG